MDKLLLHEKSYFEFEDCAVVTYGVFDPVTHKELAAISTHPENLPRLFGENYEIVPLVKEPSCENPS